MPLGQSAAAALRQFDSILIAPGSKNLFSCRQYVCGVHPGLFDDDRGCDADTAHLTQGEAAWRRDVGGIEARPTRNAPAHRAAAHRRRLVLAVRAFPKSTRLGQRAY